MPDLKMPRINRVMLAGRCTRDCEVKTVGENNTPMCKVGVAISEYRKDKDDAVVFIDVTVWGKNAEYVGCRLKKGYPIFVEGKLTQDEWTDKATGQTRRSIGINAFQCDGLTWENENGTTEGPLSGEGEIEGDDLPF